MSAWGKNNDWKEYDQEKGKWDDPASYGGYKKGEWKDSSWNTDWKNTGKSNWKYEKEENWNSEGKICKHYLAGTCNVEYCKFDHPTVCSFYRGGRCQYGSRCREFHCTPEELQNIIKAEQKAASWQWEQDQKNRKVEKPEAPPTDADGSAAQKKVPKAPTQAPGKGSGKAAAAKAAPKWIPKGEKQVGSKRPPPLGSVGNAMRKQDTATILAEGKQRVANRTKKVAEAEAEDDIVKTPPGSPAQEIDEKRPHPSKFIHSIQRIILTSNADVRSTSITGAEDAIRDLNSKHLKKLRRQCGIELDKRRLHQESDLESSASESERSEDIGRVGPPVKEEPA